MQGNSGTSTYEEEKTRPSSAPKINFQVENFDLRAGAFMEDTIRRVTPRTSLRSRCFANRLYSKEEEAWNIS